MRLPYGLDEADTKAKENLAALDNSVRADAAEARSWFVDNACPAIAIAISFSILFLVIGVKIGEHLPH